MNWLPVRDQWIGDILRDIAARGRAPHEARCAGTLAFLLAYAAASLLHSRPQRRVPEGLSEPAGVIDARRRLPGLACPGRRRARPATLLLRAGWQRTGLALIGAYALTGFFGLAHYHVAPVAAHTLAMNATIGLEVVAAALLLAAVIRRMAG